MHDINLQGLISERFEQVESTQAPGKGERRTWCDDDRVHFGDTLRGGIKASKDEMACDATRLMVGHRKTKASRVLQRRVMSDEGCNKIFPCIIRWLRPLSSREAQREIKRGLGTELRPLRGDLSAYIHHATGLVRAHSCLDRKARLTSSLR